MIVKLLSDDYIIHDTSSYDYRCAKLNLKQKLNTSNTLVFTILPNHPNYNKISKLVSIIKLIEINQDGQEVMFKGRVIESTDTIDGIRTFTCEGVLGYLNDTIQLLRIGENISINEYLKTCLDKHNQMVEKEKNIYVGDVFDNGICISNMDKKRITTMSSIQDILIDQYGGYISIREEDNRNYLDYNYYCDHLNSQEIKFKKNILDLEQYITSVDLITALIPLGEKDPETELPITIETVNDGNEYIYDEDAILKYGWIYGVKEYPKISDPNELLEKANQDLSQLTKMSLSLTITAIDLSLVEVDIEKIRLGDNLKCVSKEHKIDDYFLCVVLEKDYLDPSNSKITLDKTIATSSDLAVTTNRDILKVNNNLNLNTQVFQELVQEKVDLINGNNGGYIYTKTDSFGRPRATYYMDSNDIDLAQNILRIDASGIAFSSSGKDGPFNIAWGINRELDASYIKKGSLKNIMIECSDGIIGGWNITNIGLQSTSDYKVNENPKEGKLYFNINSNSTSILDWKVILSNGNSYKNGYLKPDELKINNIDINNAYLDQEEKINQDIRLFNENALNEVINTNIYTYQQDNEKQISFLTGNNYQISDKLLSSDKKKINIINALAIVYKAVQELNEKIEGGKN